MAHLDAGRASVEGRNGDPTVTADIDRTDTYTAADDVDAMDTTAAPTDPGQLTLSLCGDVMTGRGVDQILPHASPPGIHEPVVTSALDYVRLAEQVNGPIPRPVDHDYVWGDALEALDRARPDARIVNLETAVTTSDEAEPKGINYRMHPDNVPVLTRAGVDCCVLANNHLLDWGAAGLRETLDALEHAGIATVGAGRDRDAAWAPAVLPAPPVEDGLERARDPTVSRRSDRGRVLLFAFAATDAGVPPTWAAGTDRAGVAHLPDYSEATVRGIAERVRTAARRTGDAIVVASIHWGGNWGYEVPARHRRFAHGLVDQAGVDVVYGHSSHHPKAAEVYRDRLILYGCGDFVHDYEGIAGHERFRNDLVLMWLPALERDTGRLARLEMVPFQVRRFRLGRPSDEDRAWLRTRMDRECARFGARVTDRAREGRFVLET